MKIHRIHFENLHSLHGENSLVLDKGAIAETGLFAITGDTGAGKSTILDAITLALYGKIHRNKQVVEVMSYGTASALAEVDFSANQQLYRAKWTIWRARKKADGKIQGPLREVSQWNPATEQFDIIAEKIAEVNKTVEQVTGLDYDRFSRSVLLSQGDFDKFLKANEKERSNLLEKLTGTEIYSTISKAAFLKHKEENEKLEQLQFKIDSLDILTAEAVLTIQEEQEVLQATLQEKEAILQSQTQGKNQLLLLAEQKKKLAQVHSQMADWQGDFKALEQDVKRLEIHHQTRHLHPAIFDRRRLLKESTQALDAIFALQTALDTAQQQAKNQEEIWVKNETVFKEQKEQQKALRTAWNAARELDVKIKNKEEIIAAQRAEYQTLYNDAKEKKEVFTQLEKHFETKNKTFDKVEKWLTQHQTDAELREDLPRIQIPLENLSNIQKKNIASKKTQEELSQKLHKTKQIQAKNTQKLTQKNKEIQDIQEDFLASFPNENIADSQSLIIQLQKELDELKNTEQTLLQLIPLEKEYWKLLSQLNELEEEYQHVQLAEVQHLKTFLAWDEKQEEIQTVVEHKEAIYEQQKAIKNYELERSSLQEGEACPLCLSKEHPFRKNPHFKPRVDFALKELSQAKKELQSIENQRKKELFDLEKVEERKKYLRNYSDEMGAIPHHFQKIKEVEKQIQTLSQQSNESIKTAWEQKALSPILLDTQKQMTATQKQVKTLQQIAPQYEATQKEITNLESAKNTLQNDIHHLEERLQTLQKEYEVSLGEENHIEEKLQVYFDKYEITADHFQNDILEKRKKNYIKKEEEYAGLKEELFELKNNKNALEIALQNLEEKLLKIEETGKKERASLNETQEKRYQLLPKNQSPEKEEQLFQQELNHKENEVLESKKVWDKWKLKITQDNSILLEKEKARTEMLSRLSEVEVQLQTFAQEQKMASLDQLDKCILSSSELTRIETQKKDLDTQMTQLQQSQTTLEKDIEKLEDETENLLELADITSQIQDLQATIKNIHQQLGAYRNQLEKNEEKIKNSQQLLQEKAVQAEKCQEWKQLNELIGQADGQKFRIFAQGLTLKRLTQLANIHLLELNERYQIHKPTDKDLELQIIDTYQADHSRSVNTLSGGESFLVSLALALGLSDLAGRNTQIDSLFIDEGFGTLDTETLEVALQTLEKLQHRGKTIGVISHVQQLKERISVQVKIEKQGNGKSKMIVPS